MTAAEDDAQTGVAIRETYDEFELGGRTVATIADPDNGRAWIQSDVAVQVRP